MGCVQGYRIPLHTNHRERGLRIQEIYGVQLFLQWIFHSLNVDLYTYHASNLTVFKAFSQLRDTHLIAQA